jgi:hypothetical protein
MKRSGPRIAIAAVLALTGTSSIAYKEVSHEQMSDLAVGASVLSSQGKLNQLGLLYGIDDPNQQFPADSPKKRMVRETIRYGAHFEDSGSRAVNHFFNPLLNGRLNIDGKPIFNDTSPDWALEDNAVIGGNVAGSQDYSYRRLKDYFLAALTNTSRLERANSWGKTFQTLGQVIHHIQDMAQPQHVRNDDHLDDWLIGQLLGRYNPSTYEAWVWKYKDISTFKGYAQYAPVYSPTTLGQFNVPRDFWTTSKDSVGTGGLGMAEFTNRNFFSMRTLNSASFTAPAASTDTLMDIAPLCQGANPPCPAGVTGMISFTTTAVGDNLRPQASQTNPYARAFSVYNWDLTKRGMSGMYTLNRFTYDAAAPMLVSRAIGYSAGLLNFFFRGQMTISLPDAGVYAAVDHTTDAGRDAAAGGFQTLKLKIQNTTPSANGAIEPMGTAGKGFLYAVVKYHKNNCYMADLSGEYGSPGINWSTCRAAEEDIVVSSKIAAPSAIDSSTPQEVAFTFPTPVPISGTDMFLQVVYDGPLGQEQRAIVVATKDISEPTYLYGWDDHDQFMYAHYPALSIKATLI